MLAVALSVGVTTGALSALGLVEGGVNSGVADVHALAAPPPDLAWDLMPARTVGAAPGSPSAVDLPEGARA
ncbi:hypothetical protein [Streptomyces sp. V2I9]|uniref:hypothetical protein n=1 Tax=unclassified Streptomyces TaxID=2593676 RepID=UPI0027D7DDE0|nr:hypothetical protein [Streptomyces sp. V2I9]